MSTVEEQFTAEQLNAQHKYARAYLDDYNIEVELYRLMKFFGCNCKKAFCYFRHPSRFHSRICALCF